MCDIQITQIGASKRANGGRTEGDIQECKNGKNGNNTDDVDFNKFLEFWNKTVPDLPGCKIKKLSQTRKDKINLRVKEAGGKQEFFELIKKMWSLAYFHGANTHEWTGNLDWLIKNEENWVKLAEGKYDFAGEV